MKVKCLKGKKALLLIGSPVSRVIGNFFMGLNKPIYPTKCLQIHRKRLGGYRHSLMTEQPPAW